jgi:tRNA nucleotidyltransferase (CCA-adding enzyme)
MTGEQFAKELNKELYGDEKKYSVIKSNDGMSKHLETTTIKIFGIQIDLVNLRTETYTEESRIPEMVRLIIYISLSESLLKTL